MQMNQAGHAHEKADFHGMLLFGDATAFLYHLPMFMAPHNVQAYLEVMLTKAGADPLASYRQDRQHTGTKMYAFTPRNFVLSDLLSPAPGKPVPASMTGQIWRGHFEPGHFEAEGQPILDGVTARVNSVLGVQKLDPKTPAPGQLEYRLLGKGKELYLAHVVTRPPDFDQVIGVQVAGHSFTDEELRQGIRVLFPGRASAAAQKLKEKEQATAQLKRPG